MKPQGEGGHLQAKERDLEKKKRTPLTSWLWTPGSRLARECISVIEATQPVVLCYSSLSELIYPVPRVMTYSHLRSKHLRITFCWEVASQLPCRASGDNTHQCTVAPPIPVSQLPQNTKFHFPSCHRHKTACMAKLIHLVECNFSSMSWEIYWFFSKNTHLSMFLISFPPKVQIYEVEHKNRESMNKKHLPWVMGCIQSTTMIKCVTFSL